MTFMHFLSKKRTSIFSKANTKMACQTEKVIFTVHFNNTNLENIKTESYTAVVTKWPLIGAKYLKEIVKRIKKWEVGKNFKIMDTT